MNKQHIAIESLICLYNAFEELLDSANWACSRGCAVCCTDRVILTSLEMQVLAKHAEEIGQGEALDALAQQQVNADARPATTPNQLARLCVNNQEPPKELVPAGSAGICPFLGQGAACSVYEARPLACRMMVSNTRCEPESTASMDDWYVTLGLVFSQLVEQVDVGGGYGLISDVYAALQGEDRPLLPCENLPGIPAPPEHQLRLEAIIKNIMAKPTPGGMLLGHCLQVLQQ